jgi:hypothetical protein
VDGFTDSLKDGADCANQEREVSFWFLIVIIVVVIIIVFVFFFF